MQRVIWFILLYFFSLSLVIFQQQQQKIIQNLGGNQLEFWLNSSLFREEMNSLDMLK